MSDLTARLRLTADGREFIQVLEQAGVKVNDLGRKAESQTAGVRALSAASDSVSGSLQGMTARLGPAGAALSALGPAGIAAGAGIAAFAAGITASLSAAAEAEKLQLRLGAVLKATGNAAGFSQQQLNDFASELQGSLKINDEKITESIAVLATFRSVSGDTFKQGIKLAADMAAVFGGDMLSATRQIGLAFQDPIAGMNALRRAGVTFTETQEDLIESLQKSGDLLGAQKVMAAELENQIGGARKAEAGGLTGATDGLAIAWDDLLESIGRTKEVMAPVLAAIEFTAAALNKVSGLFTAAPEQQILALTEKISEEEKRLEKLRGSGVLSGFILDPGGLAAKRANERLEALKAERAELIKNEAKEADLEIKRRASAEASKIATQAGIALEQSALNLKEDAIKAGENADEQAKKAAAERTKEREDAYEKTLRNTNVAYEAARAENDLDDERQGKLGDYIAGLETVNRQTGLSVVAREQELAVLAAQEISVAKISEKEAERIRNAVKLRVENEEAAAAAEKLLAEISATAERMADDVSGFLVDGLVSASEGGANAFDNMWDLALGGGKRFLANIAAEILKQHFILPITTSIVGAVPGLFGIQGASGGGGGGGGALNTASSAFSLANFGSGGALTAGIGSSLFGTAATAGAPLAASFIGPSGIGATSGLLGSGGMSASLAAAGPYVAAAAAVFLAAKQLNLFGGGSTVGSNAGGRVAERNGMFFVDGVGGDRNKGPDLIPQVTQTLSTAAEALNAFVTALDEPQSGDGVGVALQLFASGQGNRNTSPAELIAAVINSGVIEGLDKARLEIITSASDVFAGMQQVLELNALPKLFADQLLQMTDPRGLAIQMAATERDGNLLRVQAVNDNGVTVANIEKIYQLQLRDIETQFASGAGAAIGSALDAALTAQGIALGRVDTAFKVLSQSVQSERDRLTTSFNAGLKTSQDALKGVSDNVARLSGISNALKSALGGMDGPGDPGASRSAAQRQISDALFAVRNGGALPDEESLRGALSVLQKPSEGLFATFTDYSRDFQITKNDISDLSNYAGWQVVKAENQAQILQRQIDQDRMGYDAEIARLDDVVSAAEAQISAVNGTTLAVLSVADAVRALNISLGAAGAASGVAAMADPITGLYRNILDRAPDAPGLDYWRQQLAGGMPIAQIEAFFRQTDEAATVRAIRGFQHGGPVRAGETILLGESGREFFTAGPTGGFVTNNAGTERALDNSAVVAKLDQVVRALAGLEHQMQNTSRSAARTAQLLHSVTQDGQSLMTRAAA